MITNENAQPAEIGSRNNNFRHCIMTTVVCIVIAMCAAGCAMSTNMGGDYGSVIPEGQKAAIVAGTTTKTQILQELGTPDQRIDLGEGKEQFSYIKETIQTSGTMFNISTKSNFTEFWIVFNGAGVVTDKGERPTTKQPKYFK